MASEPPAALHALRTDKLDLCREVLEYDAVHHDESMAGADL